MSEIITIEDLLFDIQEYTDDNGVHFPQITNLLPADGQKVYNIDLNKKQQLGFYFYQPNNVYLILYFYHKYYLKIFLFYTPFQN